MRTYRFAEVADSVVLVLLDFLGGEGGYDVMVCVRSIVDQYPAFRPSILRKVVENLDEMSSSEALRVALWLLGEYSDEASVRTPLCVPHPLTRLCVQCGDATMLADALVAVHALVGEPPFLPAAAHERKDEAVTTTVSKNVVLADGTYATVTHTETTGGAAQSESVPHLRRLICGGDVLLGTVAGVALTKMALKASQPGSEPREANRVVLGALLVCSGVGNLAQIRKGGRVGVNADCIDRLAQCCRVLLDPKVRAKLERTFLESCKGAFTRLAGAQRAAKNKAAEGERKAVASHADDLIQFRQLRSQAVQGGIEVELMDADDISRALGGGDEDSGKMRHVYQLTGYSDPVYAEASVTVHDYDIVIDMLIVNRTPSTLTNLTVELATMGDLKLVERPQSYTIGPLDERRLRANIKISSTETGHIFGTIVFDNSSTAQKTYVNLNDMQLDIMDYIRAADCKGEDFRAMWAEFEWENKVAVNTTITDLKEFLGHIVANTNMTCLGDVDSVSHPPPSSLPPPSLPPC